MKIKSVILTIILLSAFLAFSCKEEKKKDDDTKTEQSKVVSEEEADSLLSQWNYSNDSGQVSMIVFGENGEAEYVVDRPENVFLKTANGIEYKIVKASKSKRTPNVGDVMYMNMSYRTERTDSLLFASSDLGEEFRMRLAAPSDKGCIEEALMLLHEGDSAVIKVDAIKFFVKSQGKASIPAFIKKGDRLVFNVRMKKIVSGLDYANANKDMYQKRIDEENSLINRFLINMNYPLKKTDSGLHILTINKGAGKKPSVGSTVKIDYTAAFIDGSVFDSTLERSEPFSFVTGKKEVIVGLEEAVMNMQVGDHCLVIIPFRLAYGDQKYGNVIPPFSTLVFEIELLDAK
ncbi:MAG: FKBP-type peptidyl-prolyl cis-trans isomerase [Bacteroidales bacterium]|nr:FKBP-type peptidyl-prolyl cis-trans isomerase [Bacteroidales bacterium]MBQ1719938.1 FKBP-type peptidyl-prolyl cis-trans isomerase [Bacteroidales bacterium]MBQ2077406.1 FKBP-type peptidyl-prolyl cis-trans isomerase [Bacteroidales bacterium]MBQ2542893.1 FKBP-type peptidyl-prolyl cis-trans isomerase [Bacteroidales bacterium]MBQ3991423.1 FKBP-type peptidyl-prolyl cis-trans isomerase [Bacteroidales bacterium]